MHRGGSRSFEEAVEKTWDAWSSTLMRGDADGWIALWDDDPVQMPPGVPTRHGKQAILEAMKASLRKGSYEAFEIDLEESAADGDIGFARGNGRYTFTPAAGGQKSHVDAKYLTIFKRQADGSWKVHCDCVNLNAPS
jgi:uncharacterized protein (TIGR02246 family)